jgi:hypothetical protein
MTGIGVSGMGCWGENVVRNFQGPSERQVICLEVGALR